MSGCVDLFPGLGGVSMNPRSFGCCHKKKGNSVQGRGKKQKERSWVLDLIVEQLDQTEPEANLRPGFPITYIFKLLVLFRPV